MTAKCFLPIPWAQASKDSLCIWIVCISYNFMEEGYYSTYIFESDFSQYILIVIHAINHIFLFIAQKYGNTLLIFSLLMAIGLVLIFWLWWIMLVRTFIIRVSAWTCACISLGEDLQVEWLGHMFGVWIFKNLWTTLYSGLYTSILLSRVYAEFQLHIHANTYWKVIIFLILVILIM